MIMKTLLSIFILLCISLSVSGNNTIKTAPDGFQWSSFEEDGLIGVKNKKGDVIIPANYTVIDYNDGLFFVKNRSNKYSIYLNTGELLLPANDVIRINYDKSIKNSPLILLSGRRTWMAMDRKGKILVPEDYYGSLVVKKSNSGYYFQIGKNSTFGIIDKEGKVIISLNKYNRLERIEEGDNIYYMFVIYGKSNVSGVCDVKGRELIRTPYLETHLDKGERGDTIFKVRICNAYGYLDNKGNPIKALPDDSDVRYDMPNYGTGIGLVLTANGKLGLQKGNSFIIPKDADLIMHGERFYTVIKGSYWGLYDLNGSCIVAPNHYHVLVDMGDYIDAQINENHTYLDLRGKELFPMKYPSVVRLHSDSFTAWCATSEENGKCALFSNEHKQLTPFVYDEVDLLKDRQTNTVYGFIVFDNGRLGICDLNGNEIIEKEYTDFSLLVHKNKKIIKSVNGNKVGAFKTDGTMLIPAEIFNEISLSDKYIIAQAPNRLCKFTYNGDLVSDTQPNKDRDKYVSLADNEFNKSNWAKAADYYDKAIKIIPSAPLYYNRGVSHYNNKKYKRAIEDFALCLSSDPSQKLIDKSKALIAKSRQLQAEKIERRQAIIGNIFGMVLGVAASYAQYKVQNSYRPASKTANGSQRREDLDYLLDPNYAYQRVQIQNWQEYMAMTNGGKTMSYDEWFALKAQAMAGAQQSNNGYQSSSSAVSSQTSTHSITNSKGKMCGLCAGTGHCKSCDGRGYYYNSFDLSKMVTCPNCHNHDGKCSSCNGFGYK